jgi:2-oxoglutarate ferredoxin oxidoreductase subunit beta
LWLADGEPLLFNKGTQGIALDVDKLALKIVDVIDGDWQAAGVIVHDVTNRSVAHMLVELPMADFPVALGVIYDDPKPTYEGAVIAQDKVAREGKNTNLAKLLAKGQTWEVAQDQGPLAGV